MADHYFENTYCFNTCNTLASNDYDNIFGLNDLSVVVALNEFHSTCGLLLLWQYFLPLMTSTVLEALNDFDVTCSL